MNLADITPLILTYNEAPNIRRCLELLRWAPRVLVMDSGSTDETLAICKSFPNVEVVHRSFDNHTNQWNAGLAEVHTAWVLALDADYITNQAFADELAGLETHGPQTEWRAHFVYCTFGKRLRGTLYPPRSVLFDPRSRRYEQDGHTQVLCSQGPVADLQCPIAHDDRKPLTCWLDAQRRYAALEAEKLGSPEHSPTGWPDRLRTMIWPAAPAALVYTLFVRRLILDGWPGIFYALQRTYAELLLSLELLDRRLAQRWKVESEKLEVEARGENAQKE